ncbi:tetratricopeptide repeat protein [Roseomonas sp. WA12]
MIRPLVLFCLLLAGCAGESPTSDRNTARSMMRVGDHMLDSGEADSAATFYRGAAERDPTDPEPRLRLARLMARQGSPEAALRGTMEAIAADPSNTEARKTAAGILLRRGDTNSARVALDVLEPAATARDARLQRLRGVALDLMGRQAEAEDAYRRGLAVAPADADLRTNLALSLAVSGKAADAVEEARRATGSPGSGATHRGSLVLVLALAGKGEEAEREAALLPAGEAQPLLARGRNAAAQPDAATRAAALGISRPAGNGA